MIQKRIISVFKSNPVSLAIVPIIVIVLSFGLNYAYATWSEPSGTPPNNNTDTPLNVGLVAQTEIGALGSSESLVAPKFCLGAACITNWPSVSNKRVVFTSTGTWTVPPGVTGALISMAGGGGSGIGYRVSNLVATGPSGGYVLSQPVKLVPGEVLRVIVGVGGEAPGRPSAIVDPNRTPTYYIYKAPTDNGLAGYPGTSSKLISSSNGTLIECAGGSGVSDTTGGTNLEIDSYGGGNVPGDGVTSQLGAIVGSDNPQIPGVSAESRRADGPFAQTNGPGTCGGTSMGVTSAGSYGVGNSGNWVWNISSGMWSGGNTPFGYGSGGGVGKSGCFVTSTAVGLCVWPSPGRDGVVMIDYLQQ